MATNENSIDHFKNTFLKNGIARPTMYSVELTGPLETLSFQPESLTLPSRQFHVTEDDLSFDPSRLYCNSQWMISKEREHSLKHGWTK